MDDENRVDRRLAAIMAGDVAGYSRLMGIDEEGTLRQLKAHRKELVDPKITEYRGRIVKTTGDGMLVEFVSVVDAVRCAVDIQRGMAERNVTVLAENRIQFRIGINVGDIIIDSDDIFGDGVNVAARLEALADPGGIMVSRIVFDQVRDKLSFDFEDMGEQAVKNIARPVSVHRVQFADGKMLTAAKNPASDALVESAFPDKPSIAVLPFVNMSGDPEQEYFADGISEDIITGLSKLHWFFVIARNSSFTYKGKMVDVKRVARELGVRYVLEGSVRKSGTRVRITAQLIDAKTGNHVWADHYDGELSDIFELQDEITRRVIAAIEPKLLEAEYVRSQSRSPQDLNAWDLVTRANSLLWRMTKADVDAAVAMLKRATDQYPDYAPAYSMLAFALLFRGIPVGISRSQDAKEAIQLATRAAQLDDGDPWAHLALGWCAFLMHRTDAAVEEFQRALTINPNFAAALGHIGQVFAFDGQVEKAMSYLEQALRLNPHDPQNFLFINALAVAHLCAGRYSEAISFARKAIQQRSEFTGSHRIYIASLAHAGRLDEARAALDELKRLQPEISIDWIEKNPPYTQATMPIVIEGLRKAGL
jgi:adenylate cyclase